MILKIDTTERNQIRVALVGNDSEKEELTIQQKTGSQALLPAIVQILADAKIKLSDITSIEVNRGPGSFTGTRVGVSIANALGFALSIPVNGSPLSPLSPREAGKKGKIVQPLYEKSRFD